MKTVAIIVNYKSADLIFTAVQSVLESASPGPVQVVVVDNSEDGEEAERLRQGLPSSVALLVSPENIGFGRACNLAFEQFPADQILLINPDARLLPGCLLNLQKRLFSTENAAAVSPHIFWDPGLKFFLPSSYPRTILEFQSLFDPWGPHAWGNRLLSAIWRYHSIKVWRSKRPVKVTNLSGSLVLLKASAVRRAGGLFDPRFFLYFEDTDLFIRLRKRGFSLFVEPKARAIHYYDQCGREEWVEKRSLMARSHRIFLKKQGNGLRSRILLGRLKHRASEGIGRLTEPDFTAPFLLEVPPHLHQGWFFEWSPNPTLIPSSGRFGEGPLLDFMEAYWKMLSPGQYFGRLGSPMTLGKYDRLVSWVVEERGNHAYGKDL